MRKRLLSTLLALCMVLALLPATARAADYPTSGTCGENATWTYDDSTKTLTISGSGKIDRFHYVNENGNYTPYAVIEKTEKVKFNGNFTAIGGSAFSYLPNLREIEIPSGVTMIGTRAFYGCSNLSKVTIQNGVKYIEDNAFEGCNQLTHISIPASVIRMTDPFSGCTSLTEISVDPQNTEYASQDGALFTKEKDTLLFCPEGKTDFSIPDGVGTIGGLAFHNHTKLTAITIPNSVERIENDAFWGCSQLTTATFPGAVSSIGLSAFAYCTSLKTVNFQDNTAGTIQNVYMNNTFQGCTSLTDITIPEGVTSLYGTFWGCSNLETIHLPVSLTRISSGTFL